MTDFRSKTFLADWIRRNTPTREDMAKNRYLRPIAHRFLSPELWRFTRRSVPRGVALGLFAAFIVPLGQIFLAAFLAFPARANVPLAAMVTFVTNPFTFAFWAIIAKKLGDFMINIDRSMGGLAMEDTRDGFVAWAADALGVAAVAYFGFVVLAVVSAAVGYLLSSWVWRYLVGRKRDRQLAGLKPRKFKKHRKAKSAPEA